MAQHPDIRKGLKIPSEWNLEDNPFILSGTEDPSVLGVRAAPGSIFCRTTGQIYRKFGLQNDEWVLIDAGSIPIEEIKLGADQFDNPVNADFAVNALAPAQADSNNAALIVRAFDDLAEEGVAFGLTLPSHSSSVVLRLTSRAATAPVGVDGVVPKLYARTIPDNAPVGAWSAGDAIGEVSIPSNEFFQYDTFIISFATLGIAPDTYVQFELTRDPAEPADDLVGDWFLLEVGLSFV